jgi:hypothetical protein
MSCASRSGSTPQTTRSAMSPGGPVGDKDKTREAIKACGKRISGAARQICEDLEAQSEIETVADREAVERAALDVPVRRQAEAGDFEAA